MASPVLGIDLGTTNSVVAVCDGGEPRVLVDALGGGALTPSVVSFHPSGQVLVGDAARQRRMIDAQNTVFSIKRLIGRPFRSVEVQRAAERLPFALRESATGGVMADVRGESYTLPELSALVLRKLRGVAEQQLGQSCVHAVVTVPANFNDLQRTATRDAGRIAGLDVLRVLNEPTAAALAYGYDSGTRERIAVYDLGGGTFDVSILDLSGDVIEVIASAGDSYLGGDDVDWAIADRMVAHFLEAERIDLGADAQAYERLRVAAEWLKCELSTREQAVVRIEDVAYAHDGSAVDLEYQMTRSELDQLTFPLVGRTFDICETALRTAGLHPTQLDNVVLVGGQTRSPKVRSLVAEYFGREPLTDLDPCHVVAEGAAVQGLVLGGGRFSARAAPPTQPPSAPPPGDAPAPVDDEPTRIAPRPPRVPQGASPSEGVTRVSAPPLAAFDEDEQTSVAPRPSAAPRPRPPRSVPAGIRGKPIGAVTLSDAASGPPPRPPGAPRPSGAPRGTAPPPVPPAAKGGGREATRLELPTGPPGPPSGIEVEPSLPPPSSSLIPDELPRFHTDEPPPPTEPPPPMSGMEAALQSEPPPSDGPPRERKSRPAPTVPPARAGKVPLLLDVTPRSLAIETTGGFCEQLIERNSPIPTEQTRRFSTSRDDQTEVHVRVCQGEKRTVEDNQELGHVRLTRLREDQRGKVKIDVTFGIDADGMLNVRARDEQTGKAQRTRIDLVGALSDDDVQAARERQALMDFE